MTKLYDKEPEDDTLAELLEIQLDLNLEADKKELFWEQRARVNLLTNREKI